MKARLIRLLRRLLDYLDPPPPPPILNGVLLFVPDGELLARARELAAAQNAIVDRDGEAKRHQVYARLLKEFKTRTRKDIALAIEAAVR